MDTIDVRRMGLACGTTGVLLYAGCVLLMWVQGPEATAAFLNSLLHGIDVRPLLRTSMPVREMAQGLVAIFLLGWLVGASVASIYNFAAPGRRQGEET